MKLRFYQVKLLLLFAFLHRTVTAIATGDKGSVVILPQQAGTIRLRFATPLDVESIHRCNLACLPENYNPRFYNFQIRRWPDFSLVAEHLPTGDVLNDSLDDSGKEPLIVGYMLGKIVERPYEDYRGTPRVEILGRATSLAVLQDYRRLGLAKGHMTQLHDNLLEKGIDSCSLHVKTSNEAACRLYKDDGYEIERLMRSYYREGVDAYYMKKKLG